MSSSLGLAAAAGLVTIVVDGSRRAGLPGFRSLGQSCSCRGGSSGIDRLTSGIAETARRRPRTRSRPDWTSEGRRLAPIKERVVVVITCLVLIIFIVLDGWSSLGWTWTLLRVFGKKFEHLDFDSLQRLLSLELLLFELSFTLPVCLLLLFVSPNLSSDLSPRCSAPIVTIELEPFGIAGMY